MANRNWASGGKIYSMHKEPVLLDCNFVIDVDNVNGLGISDLKGPCISAVYSHSTAATPSSINPAAGTIVVRLSDKYSRSFSGFKAIISPTDGSAKKIDNSDLTAGVAYVISTLGNSSAAAWHALGVPAGVTPAVGVSFIAASVGAGANSSTSRVMASAALGSNVCTMETVGDINLSINPNPAANQGYGAQIILQCRDYAGAIVQPADDSIISLAFYISNSSITVQGE